MRLMGKVAIVTGGAQGIGKAYAQRLASEGASVVVADILGERASETATEIRATGAEALAVRADVADEGSVDEIMRLAAKEFGRIDVLVNNAALFVALFPKKPFTEISGEEWDRVMAVNVKGMFYCCKSVFPFMRAQGKGKIVNISSSTIWHGTTALLHYVTSKAAVIGLTRQLAREMGDYNICVNAVTPGLTLSEGVERVYAPEYLAKFQTQRIIKRIEQPADLVGTIVFLASDDSDFITGQTVNVDGGEGFN